jgi:site-specific recombinase XerD
MEADMDLVTQYLIEAHAEGRSPKTLAWHRDSLKQFMAWLAATGLSGDPESWTVADVRSYIVYQQGRTNTRTNQPLYGSYMNGLISGLKAFCRWLYGEERVGQDLVARVKVPKLPTIVVPALSGSEINRLLASIRAGR